RLHRAVGRRLGPVPLARWRSALRHEFGARDSVEQVVGGRPMNALVLALLSAVPLPADVQTQFSREIARARTEHPSAFVAVATVHARMAQTDAHKRGRYATVAPVLETLGADGLWAMVEVIAF